MIAVTYADFRRLFGAGQPIALDGLPTWPADEAVNFGPATPDPLARTVSGWQFTFPLSIDPPDGLVPDSVFGVDDWDYYLSQPSQVTTPRMFLAPQPPAGGLSYSSRVYLSLTASGLIELGDSKLGAPHSAVVMDAFLKGVFIYARDRVNEVIYVLDFHRAAFSPASLEVY